MTNTNIFDYANDLAIGLDLSGKIIYANKKASEFFGLSTEDLSQKKLMELIPKEKFNEYEAVRNKILFNEEVKPFETILINKDKTLLNVSISYSPIKAITGKLLGITVVARPVPEIKKAENKAQALLETAPDAMIIVNNFGQIVLANAQTEKVFGYNRDELYGKPVEILIPKRFTGQHSQHRKNYSSQPKTRSMGAGLELYGIRKNGEEFPVEISLSPLQTDEGTFVSAAVRDITERKKAEQKFRNLLESAPDAIVIVNKSGLIQLVNAQTEKLFGYNRSEIIGQPVERLIPERFHRGHLKHRTNYSVDPKLRPMGEGLELFGRKKDNTEFPVEISLSPMETEEGLVVSAAIRDISEKKKLEKKLKEANTDLEKKVQLRTAELERQNKELEQFAFIASHDLQEPLRTITSFVELLNKKYSASFDDNAKQYLDFVIGASKRMSDLIRGLLEYSRIGRSSELQRVDANTVVNDVIKDLENKIKLNNATINLHELPVINAYKIELKLLFQNLISNAIKFRKPDVDPVIKISFVKVPGFNKFTVEDNGIGINPKYFEKIFIIYQRLNPTMFEGSGIGLAYCKKIVEMHGGHIWIESAPGEGSKFLFTIPD